MTVEEVLRELNLKGEDDEALVRKMLERLEDSSYSEGYSDGYDAGERDC